MKTTWTSGAPPPNPAHTAPDEDERNILSEAGSGIESDNAAENNLTPCAVRVSRVRRVSLEANVIDLPIDELPDEQMLDGATDALKYFDNQTPAGRLVPGADWATRKIDDELTTMIEDSMIMALL